MNKELFDLTELKNVFVGHCKKLNCSNDYINVCENKFDIIEKELKDYQEIKEIAKHYNWNDITGEIFDVKTDKKYRDLFDSAIIDIQEDYRKARALEILNDELEISFNDEAQTITIKSVEESNPYVSTRISLMRTIKDKEKYKSLKEVLL